MKHKYFKIIGFIVLTLIITISIGGCDFGDPIESYISNITITDVNDELIEEDAEAFSVYYEGGIIDDFEYDEENIELTASAELQGDVDLILQVDIDEVLGGGFYIFDREKTVAPTSPDIDFRVLFIEGMEKEIFVGFDPHESDSDHFGDEDPQFLDLIFDVDLRHEFIENYSVTIKNNDQEYTLRHKDGTLEFRFVEDYDWIEIVYEGGDISAAVDGLDGDYIEDITDFRVTEVFILDENNEKIIIPEEGIQIIEWSPEFPDGGGLTISSERFNLQR